LRGTLNLRDAVARWPPGESRFATNPVKFFATSEYRKNPEFWDRTSRSDGDVFKKSASAADIIRRTHDAGGAESA
jgi:hypothetical protein